MLGGEVADTELDQPPVRAGDPAAHHAVQEGSEPALAERGGFAAQARDAFIQHVEVAMGALQMLQDLGLHLRMAGQVRELLRERVDERALHAVGVLDPARQLVRVGHRPLLSWFAQSPHRRPMTG